MISLFQSHSTIYLFIYLLLIVSEPKYFLVQILQAPENVETLSQAVGCMSYFIRKHSMKPFLFNSKLMLALIGSTPLRTKLLKNIFKHFPFEYDSQTITYYKREERLNW